MNKIDLNATIEQLKAQIEAEEKEYANAIILKRDYNTLKTIRNKIADLKKKLKELDHMKSN
jgi:enoyl-[acyl-carrier-protein] reductase (NADH)